VKGDLDGLGYRDATVVLVGCSTGIGAATAKVLVDLGARLHTVSRNPPPITGERFHPIDLTDPAAIAATARALGDIGPIDHLLVPAGVPKTRPNQEILQVNYFGVRQLVEAVVPAMPRGAAIGLVASNTAFKWEFRVPQLLEVVAIDDPAGAWAWCEARPELFTDPFHTYIFSKSLLLAWATHWAPTLANEHGIRLNCTSPGPTATPMVDEIAAEIGWSAFDAYPHPVLGRTPTAEEQAWPLLLLNCRLNAVATGEVLVTDEGVSAGLLTGSVDLSALTASAAEN
jgi:NAD(P)-dependent dehydrogenase (short-subunit alcohol dehydrogenase family)